MPQAVLFRSEVFVEVPFHDVDIMRIAWHGHYVKYFEIARTALIRELDYDIDAMERDGFAWPIVESSPSSWNGSFDWWSATPSLMRQRAKS